MQLEIEEFVRRRCHELDLTLVQLVQRCGYRNTSKGLQHLQRIFDCHPKTNASLLRNLPRGLEVSADVLAAAIKKSHDQIAEAEFAAWCRVFVPHAIICTEREIPEPIFVAALVGVAKLKRVDFDATLSSDDIHTLIQAEIARRQATSGTIVSFGKATGYVINWSVDHAERFDLYGQLIEKLPRPERLGVATLSVKGRDIARPLRESLEESESKIRRQQQ